VIANVQADILFRSSNYIRREEIKSTVIFPLRVEGENIGLLIADYRNPVNLPKEKIEALSLFADFVALVLHEAQLNSRLSEIQQKLSRRIFLDWVSMIEASWRHSLVQRAATILNHTAILKQWLSKHSNLPTVMDDVPVAIEKIDQLAREIANAPPRVPQSWELEPELLPLAALLEGVARRENTQPHCDAAPQVHVKINIEALGGIQVRGYRRWLIYALEALLQNARRAMPTGGTVMITGQVIGPWIEVRIQDNGGGVPQAIHHKLFKELIPPMDDKQGMGIGSLLVATIIEMHNGEISLEKPGPGDTTVLIRLPPIKGQ
jgi:signal transduction histidine kinase